MPRPTKIFNAHAKQRAEDAIFDAEQKTGAEIVVVVANRSGGYARVADVFGLACATAITLVLMWVFEDHENDWVFPTRTHLHPAIILGVMLGAFAVFAALADTNPVIVRTVAGKRRLRRHVDRSAPSWFQRLRVSRTQQRVGVMLYISLFEKMVTIIPDDAFESMLAEHQLEPVRLRLQHALDAGTLPRELPDAISQAGDILARALPAPKKNMDELPNELHLID
ncbi:MAG: hypothetical protein KDA31_02170 [Phycisphaerales bacterium]|nr:hypothetical protein [Phycisphaerales bacterium]MCB9835636.1 hypothetical protein [Phycisphaera sp.]